MARSAKEAGFGGVALNGSAVYAAGEQTADALSRDLGRILGSNALVAGYD